MDSGADPRRSLGGAHYTPPQEASPRFTFMPALIKIKRGSMQLIAMVILEVDLSTCPWLVLV